MFDMFSVITCTLLVYFLTGVRTFKSICQSSSLILLNQFYFKSCLAYVMSFACFSFSFQFIVNGLNPGIQ